MLSFVIFSIVTRFIYSCYHKNSMILKLLAIALMLTALLVAAQDNAPVPASDKPQLSGTVVDTSGAAIAGATVQVQSANGTVLTTTQSDTNGSFTISGLSAGDYRLVVSHADFETKEIPVTIGPPRRRPRCASLWL